METRNCAQCGHTFETPEGEPAPMRCPACNNPFSQHPQPESLKVRIDPDAPLTMPNPAELGMEGIEDFLRGFGEALAREGRAELEALGLVTRDELGGQNEKITLLEQRIGELESQIVAGLDELRAALEDGAGDEAADDDDPPPIG